MRVSPPLIGYCFTDFDILGSYMRDLKSKKYTLQDVLGMLTLINLQGPWMQVATVFWRCPQGLERLYPFYH
jgi:hypothetical protein